jgi:drug/metabolite transporter (DMT)-like permease
MINGNLGRKASNIITESRLAYAMLASSVVFWGGSSVVGKFVGRDLPPFTIGGIRIALASAILFFYLKRQKGFSLPQRRDWPMLLALGILGIFGCNALFHLALQYTTATNTALIAAGSPLFITLFSAILLREKISRLQATGIIISLIGVVVVITKGSWSVLINLDFNIGDVIMIGNPIFWGLYTVFTKKLVDRYSPLVLGTYANLVAVIFFVPFSIFELANLQSGIHVTTVDLGALAYLGLMGSSIGVIWWNKGIEKVGASRAGVFMNGAPVSSMLLSALLLGEKIGLPQILGSAMVFTGVYLNSRRSRAN